MINMIMTKKKFLKSVLFLILLVVFFVVIWIIVRDTENFENCWAENQRNCGDDESLESFLLPEDEPSLSSPSIMLLEGHFNDHLSPRMLCTIESVAMTHPNEAVNVMMLSKYIKITPVTRRIITTYRNINIFNLNTTNLYSDSPFNEWLLKKKWKKSFWPKSHFNDVIRWMLLWKYGGIYLDMDVVVLRNLMKNKNFSALESDQWVGAGALGFTPKHHFVEECLMKMVKNFDGTVWGAVGPELLTKTLIEKCGMEPPSRELKACPDIKIYESKSFYPLPWWEWSKYLKDDEELANKMLNDPEVLGFHVWNFHIHKFPVNLKGVSPFAVAAKKACPEVVDEVGRQF